MFTARLLLHLLLFMSNKGIKNALPLKLATFLFRRLPPENCLFFSLLVYLWLDILSSHNLDEQCFFNNVFF